MIKILGTNYHHHNANTTNTNTNSAAATTTTTTAATTTLFLQKIQLELNALWQHGMGNIHYIFLELCVLVKILSKGISMSMLTNESHGEDCKHKCQYHVVTSH
jgi:hypothetical protein